MKFICFLACVLVLMGCVDPPPPKTHVWIERQLLAFIGLHGDWNSDDQKTRDEITTKFQVEAVSWTREPGYLTDMPFEATQIRDTLIGKYRFVLAEFKTYQDPARSKSSMLNRIDLRINGIFRLPEFAKNLKLGHRYYLGGVVYKRGKRKTVGISAQHGVTYYHLGVHDFSIEQLEEVEQENQSESI